MKELQIGPNTSPGSMRLIGEALPKPPVVETFEFTDEHGSYRVKVIKTFSKPVTYISELRGPLNATCLHVDKNIAGRITEAMAVAVVEAYWCGREDGEVAGRSTLQHEFRKLFGIPSHSDLGPPMFGRGI